MKTLLELGKWMSLALSIITFIFFIGLYFQAKYRIENWSPVVAYVDRLEPIIIDGNNYYAPVVHYKLADNELEYKFSSGSNPPKYKIGDQISVYVNPDNPCDVIMASGDFFWWVLLLNSIMLMIISCACAFTTKRLYARQCL